MPRSLAEHFGSEAAVQAYLLAHPWQISVDSERRVNTVLEAMRQEGILPAFLRTKRLQWSDRPGGVDFYLVIVGAAKRIIARVSVSGRVGEEGRDRSEPLTSTISVDLSRTNTDMMIRNQILAIIAAHRAAG